MATKLSNQEKIDTIDQIDGQKNENQRPVKPKRKVSFAKNDGIRQITSVKSLADCHHDSFIWKIQSFRRFMDAKSVFVLNSPTFSCPSGPHQLSEWYLSLSYSPEGSGSIRVGIFLKNLKGVGSNEIRAHVTLSTLRSKGGLAMNCGTVKRNFKVPDRGLIANRHFGNVNEARRCCEKHSRSECHEWFETIPIKKLSEGPLAVLSENILSLKADVKVWEWTDRILGVERSEPVFVAARSRKSEELPNPIKFWEQQPNPDCVIMCDDGIFKVHKNILSAASPVFSAMIDDLKFNEEDSIMPSEFHLPAIIIKGIEAAIVAIILECIYSGTLGTFEHHPMNLEISTKLFQAIERYRVGSAKTLLFRKIVNELNWYNAGYYAVLAQKFKAPSDTRMIMNKYLRSNWGILQQSEEFRDVFKSRPDAFEFVFS